MKASYELQKQGFKSLLGLFSRDPEEAGRRYETVRRGLIRYFRVKGCNEPELLADETIDRIAKKASIYDAAKSPNPTTFIYGFAVRVLFEYRRSDRIREVPLTSDQLDRYHPVLPPEPAWKEREYDCLDRCLSRLQKRDRDLVLEYYSLEKIAKIKLRKQMAARLACRIQTLHTRMFFIRNDLKDCIFRCMEKKHVRNR